MSVLRCNWHVDWKRLYDAGVGYSAEKRRYRHFEGCGYDAPLRSPDVVVQEVEGVMRVLEERGFR